MRLPQTHMEATISLRLRLLGLQASSLFSFCPTSSTSTNSPLQPHSFTCYQQSLSQQSQIQHVSVPRRGQGMLCHSHLLRPNVPGPSAEDPRNTSSTLPMRAATCGEDPDRRRIRRRATRGDQPERENHAGTEGAATWLALGTLLRLHIWHQDQSPCSL